MGTEHVRGFSLIELLVVVAIILLLIAILIPVFVAVQDQAALVGCQLNLKQLGLGFHMYAADNNATLPLNYSCGTSCLTHAVSEWAGPICQYLGAKGIRDPIMLELLYCPSKGDFYRWQGFIYKTSYFNYLKASSPTRPLILGRSSSQSKVLADFRWKDPADRWLDGQFDRYALIDPDDSSRRHKTSHPGANRNTLYLDNSVLVHNFFK
jgi:prepilin-type N-terminal cleavage/methylation domain-containing protein